MSGYEPKKGDCVRVVLEGPVVGALDGAFHLGDGWEITYPDPAVVSVEKIQPQLPTTYGSVIAVRGTPWKLVLRKDGRWQFLHASCGLFDSPSAVLDNFKNQTLDVLFDAGA